MKKILSILLSLAMLLSITAEMNLTAYADTVGGSCGPNAYWSLNKETGEFKIYGSGDVTSRPWRENNCELLRSTRTIEISGVNNVSYGSFLYEGSSWKSFPVNKIIVGKGIFVSVKMLNILMDMLLTKFLGALKIQAAIFHMFFTTLRKKIGIKSQFQFVMMN